MILARAERHLTQGDVEQAMSEVEQLLARRVGPKVQERGIELLGRSAYLSAKNDLSQSKFDRVRSVASRATELGVKSPAVLNLELQAKQNVPDELSVNHEGTLLDFGYAIDGSRVRGPVGSEAPQFERLQSEYESAIQRYPRNVNLLVNFGHLLLRHNRTDEAERLFRQALNIEATNPQALLGLGLVEYRSEAYERALELFLAVLKLAPDNQSAHFNAAMALERLGRRHDAGPHWERALQLIDEPSLRQQIQEHRQATGK
jgi:tetratricopeptide (TPR) repeat protein